ncbi:hypothetical protein ACEE86_23530, partial [Proteus mirabilis]
LICVLGFARVGEYMKKNKRKLGGSVRRIKETGPVTALLVEKNMKNRYLKSENDWRGYSIEIVITYRDLKHQGMASKTIEQLKTDLNIKNDTFIHQGDAVHCYKPT